MVYIQRYLSFMLLLSCFSIFFSCDAPPDLVFDNPLDGKQSDNNDNPQNTQEIKFTQLTTDPSTDCQPSWSPDGRTIAYVSGDNNYQDIWTIPASGGTPTKITTYNGVDGYGPEYSPDGSKILYTTTMNSKGLGIWSIPSKGGTPTKIYDSGANDFGASWSPNGSQIVFRSETPNQTLWVVSSDGSGSGLIKLTSTWNYSNPDWNPNVSIIMFHSLSSGLVFSDLFTIPSTGGILTQLTNTPTWNETYARYSQDGQWIVFESDRSGKSGIWVMPSSGGEQTLIIDDVDPGSSPAWSPDGSKIVFSNDFDIYIASDLPINPVP